MGRVPCCEKEKVKRGQWTPEEDNKLSSYIAQHGTRNWRLIPKNAGLQRCGKSCRLRWTNYLRPDLKHGQFSPAEEETIMKLHAVVGNRWSLIAAQLPGRTDNDVKNHWNTKLKKKLTGMGIDPVTHKSFSHLMAEIATTLGPPQVANLTEAALGCFKDEMLHLLTKKRIDSQLLPAPNNFNTSTTATTLTTTDHTTYSNPANHLNINNNRDPSNVIMMSRNAYDHQGAKNVNDTDDHDDTAEKIKLGLSRAIRHCPPPYRHDIFISNNNNNNNNNDNILKPCWELNEETMKQQQVSGFAEFQYGHSCFGGNNNGEEDEENDGSPWNQSMCTGSTSTAGAEQALGYLKLDQQGHENNNNATIHHGDGDDSQGIGIKEIRNGSSGIFSSDCVLWDIPSDELVNPMI